MRTYKCITCDRLITTDKEFPEGQWACPECKRRGVIIQMTCSVCGKKFPIQFRTWEMKDKKGETVWRCRRCNDDYRNSLYESKSPEEKAAFVAKQVARTKAYYANMTDEERAKNSQNRKDGWKKRYDSGTAVNSLLAMKNGRKKWWENLSDDDKRKQLKYLHDGRVEWWNNISDEDRAAYLKVIGEKSKEFWDSMTPEARELRSAPSREAFQSYWENIDSTIFQNMRVESAIKLREFKDDNPDAQPFTPLTPTEVTFSDMLKVYNLSYIPQYPSIKVHPDFNKIFTANEATGSNLIDPTHLWDFVVRTKSTDVFIDVDGSIHNPSNNPINAFNDKKRPYQTDGLPAYIVNCPDDKLTLESEVINVATGEKSIVSSLLAILREMDGQLNDK